MVEIKNRFMEGEDVQVKRVYKLQKDSPDLRDNIYQAKAIIHPKDLPPAVNLRSRCSPVVDQGELGSCTANAIASGLREYLMIQAKQPLVRLSRLFLYYERNVCWRARLMKTAAPPSVTA
ncbi:hypothetical protein [Desulforamulus profundi]|uniref:hypothetical protein n=1 Tax=Desulforamulus profundi TaxID=1383067 RepID=UPI001EE55232|nr:hypothetical protein [Desulforamulus profundi]